MSRPAAVLFDYFDTLVAHVATADDHGRRLGCPEEFAAVWADWGARRMTTATTYAELVHEACRRASTPVDARLIADLVEERHSVQRSLLHDPQPDVLETVSTLHRCGLRLGVISNAAVEDAAGWASSELGSHFDATAFSFEVGVMKPDPLIYRVALARLGVTADQAAIVSDSIGDLFAARRIGIEHCYWATWFLDLEPSEVPPGIIRLRSIGQVLHHFYPDVGVRQD